VRSVRWVGAGFASLQHVVLGPNLNTYIKMAEPADYTSVTARNDADTAAFEPEWLAFDHPLWIVYSSGTTGLPKPIVHGHGGMVLVALQLKGLYNDIGCSYESNSWGERYHWYSSTGWVMWNAQVSGLLGGTTCVIFDGSPGGSKDKPHWLQRLGRAAVGRRALACTVMPHPMHAAAHVFEQT